MTSNLVNHVYGIAGGRSPRSSLWLERPPLGRGFVEGLCWLGVEVLLDFLADGTELVHDFLVGEPDHGDVELLECNGTGSVPSQAFGSVVLAAIKFDHESSGGAIKIWNERTDGSLPQESNLVTAQELIPKFAFRRSHFRPKLSSEACQRPSVRNSPHQKTVNNHKSQNPNNPYPQKPSLVRGGRSPREVNP